MKVIASIALATLLTGCASIPEDENGCSLFCSASRAPAPGVQLAAGTAAQTGQHTSAKLR